MDAHPPTDKNMIYPHFWLPLIYGLSSILKGANISMRTNYSNDNELF